MSTVSEETSRRMKAALENSVADREQSCDLVGNGLAFDPLGGQAVLGGPEHEISVLATNVQERTAAREVRLDGGPPIMARALRARQ